MKLDISLLRTLVILIAFLAAGPGAAAGEIELINVYDAFGGTVRGVTQDFGFSMVVKYRGQTILFDSGTNASLFEKNLKALDIDPMDIDIAIASHNHHDHIAGFDYLLKVNPQVKIFLPRDFTLGAPVRMPIVGQDSEAGSRLPREMQYFGGEKKVASIESSGRFWTADAEYVGDTTKIGDGMTLIATQSELMGVFMRYPPFEDEPRLVPMPELSLSFATDEGEVLLVGCSHSSVEVIVEQTREELKRDIRLLVGGFHLLPYDSDYIEGLAQRLQQEHKVEHVAPAHCSGHLAFEIFRKKFDESYRLFGLGSVLRF